MSATYEVLEPGGHARLVGNVLDRIASASSNPASSAGSAAALLDAPTESAWLARESVGDGSALVESVKGNTLRWNQLVGNSDTSVTVPSGHKYVSRIDGTAALATSDGTAISVTGGSDCIFDLTAMFGAGNEPTTVAEFEALYPNAYYAYDAGSLLDVQMTGIVTTDADESWTSTLEIPATDLRSAGTVRDELRADRRITRVGVVDLGTLTWQYNDSGYFYSYIGTKQVGNYNLTCARYQTTASDSVANMSDKEIKGHATSNSIFIKDSAYTDATTFKASLDGMYCNYGLATPTTTAIDPPLCMSYRTAKGGTESIAHTDPTAPPVLDVRYPLDHADVRDSALAAIAPVEGAKASTNYAVGSYLVHGGTLYRVTSAIASGESITPGTNVTATTVMAELVSLTS